MFHRKRTTMNDNASIYSFDNRNDFRKWLETNHSNSEGIWLMFNKGSRTFSAHDALEEAICFGWIDGLMKSINEKTYKKYFSKRKDKNKWSDKNKKIHKKLQEIGLMTQAGIEAYKVIDEIHTSNNRDDLNNRNIKSLKDAFLNNDEIVKLFEEKSPSRQKQLAGFYCDAKTEETRKKRLVKIIEALKSGNKGMLY
jgi:uncharacterized protein YdeI (YjbR/CyaY-like superfamily)